MEREVGRGQENAVKTSTVTLKPFVVEHATIPHMIAMDLPFHIRYGSLICYKKLQGGSTRVESKHGCLSLSAYQLAVSLNLEGYHTSYERGESGLPADLEISIIVLLIGIL